MIKSKDFHYSEHDKLFVAIASPDTFLKFFDCYIRPPYKYDVPVTFNMRLSNCKNSPAMLLNKANINYINNCCKHLSLPKPKVIPVNEVKSYCDKHGVK